MLARLLAVAHDIQARVFLGLDPQQRASALAWRSASPSAFHWGQSLLVSASQAGLGRLPAMEVSNIREFL
jgi:hypothetical protein